MSFGKNKEEKAEAITPEEQKNEKTTRMTNLAVIIGALVFAGISAIALFVPEFEVKPIYLGYLLGIILVIAGIVFIVRYFMTDAYKNVNAYGFSVGTFLVIIGICAILRADAIASVVDLVLGFVVLLMGVIMLQHSLDLRRMKDMMWALVIIFAIIVIVCGVFLMIKPVSDVVDYPTYNWWAVLFSSVIGLIFNIYTLIRVAIYNKKEKNAAAHPEDNTDTSSGEAYAGHDPYAGTGNSTYTSVSDTVPDYTAGSSVSETLIEETQTTDITDTPSDSDI